MKLNLNLLPYFVRFHRFATISEKDSKGEYTNVTIPEENIERAEVVTSQNTFNDLHRPVLDIDIAAALIPSSSNGHYHLYLDKTMHWKQYEKLLLVLAEVGIIEEGYAQASIERKYTAVRLPWISK